MNKKNLFLLLALSITGCNQTPGNKTANQASSTETLGIQDYLGTGKITQGLAVIKMESIFTCSQEAGRPNAPVGEISDLSGNAWTVPGSNHFEQADKAYDLYNDCNQVTPNNISEVDLNSVPVAEIDQDGEIITGYIFADNYFEFYVNGILIAIDPIPFVPFNSNVVKYKVKTPYTIAVKLIDWEESLGLGLEKNRESGDHAGDGGFIASFSDGTKTDGNWKAQTFYTAPVKDLNCLSESGQNRLSNNCNTDDVEDGSSFYAVHWDIPTDSFDSAFDDSQWPNATTYTEEVIGVDNKKAYMNFIEKFSGSGAEFIWSTNVILDNEVIVRYTVE